MKKRLIAIALACLAAAAVAGLVVANRSLLMVYALRWLVGRPELEMATDQGPDARWFDDQ